MASILSQNETALTFQDSGGSAVITLATPLAANVGRVSARYDRGTGLLSRWYTLEGTFQKSVAGVVGQIITVGLFLSDGTRADGTVGTADAALTANQMLNAFVTLEVVVWTTSTNTDIVQRKLIELPPLQYISAGVMNSLIGALRASANTSRIALTPFHEEV